MSAPGFYIYINKSGKREMKDGAQFNAKAVEKLVENVEKLKLDKRMASFYEEFTEK